MDSDDRTFEDDEAIAFELVVVGLDGLPSADELDDPYFAELVRQRYDEGNNLGTDDAIGTLIDRRAREAARSRFGDRTEPLEMVGVSPSDPSTRPLADRLAVAIRADADRATGSYTVTRPDGRRSIVWSDGRREYLD